MKKTAHALCHDAILGNGPPGKWGRDDALQSTAGALFYALDMDFGSRSRADFVELMIGPCGWTREGAADVVREIEESAR